MSPKLVLLVVAFAILIIGVGQFFIYTNNTGLELQDFLIIIMASSGIALFWILFIVVIDSLEREPFCSLMFCFALGAAIAPSIAFHVNNWVYHRYGINASHLISAPIIEEILKIIVVCTVLKILVIDRFGLMDSVTYCSMVCLGFAMTENTLYLKQEIQIGQSWVHVFCVRMVTGMLHAMYTSLFIVAKRKMPGWKGIVVGCSAAIGMHSMWNWATTLDMMLILDIVIWIFPPCLFVGILIAADAKREKDIVLKKLVDVTLSERKRLSRRFKRLWEVLLLCFKLRYNDARILDRYFTSGVNLAFAREKNLDDADLKKKFETNLEAMQGAGL